MSEPHLDFSQDHLPTAELRNEHAHSDFDWPTVFRDLDGEMGELRQDLEPDQFAKLEGAVVAIFAWILNTRDTGGHGIDCATGRRFLTLASVLTPNLVAMKRQELTKEFKISRQGMHDAVKDAKRFLMTLRV